MNEWHNEWHKEWPDFRYYVEQAHEARAEAMTRTGYLAVTAVGRGARAVAAAATTIAGPALQSVAAWRQRRRAVHALSRLDDRMLRDIGITRADIWAVADGTLHSRAAEPETAEPVVDRDIAFTTYALGGCNDNDRRRAA